MKRLTLAAIPAMLLALASTAPGEASRPSFVPETNAFPICRTLVADAREDFATNGAELEIRYWLARINGHLNAADQLAKAGRLTEALSHINHPLEEEVAEIGPLLQRFNLNDLAANLIDLRESFKKPEFHSNLQLLQARLALVTNRLPLAERRDLDRNAAILTGLVQATAKEFDEAWIGLNIKNLVEYQDAFVFHGEASKFYAEMKGTMEAKNPKSAAIIEKALRDMAKAWPTIDPAPKPEYPSSTVRALARVVEMHLLRVTTVN